MVSDHLYADSFQIDIYSLNFSLRLQFMLLIAPQPSGWVESSDCSINFKLNMFRPWARILCYNLRFH